MKKTFMILFSVFLIYGTAYACSTFNLKDEKNIVVGFNFDFPPANGVVSVNNKGNKKVSLVSSDEKDIKWISKYQSITFNVISKELPIAGMNSQGLVVTMMADNDIKYPEKDDRPAIGQFQWIQYQLDNYSNTKEVLDNIKNLRIYQSINVPIHYFICDKDNNIAIIEFINHKPVIYQKDNLPIPMLTNLNYKVLLNGFLNYFLHYQQSNIDKNFETIKDYQGHALKRFVIGTYSIKAFNENPKDINNSAMNILKEVSNDYTKWSVVFNIATSEIQYRTWRNESIRSISLNNFKNMNYSNSLFYNIDRNINNVVKDFKPFTPIENNKLMESNTKLKTWDGVIPDKKYQEIKEYIEK